MSRPPILFSSKREHSMQLQAQLRRRFQGSLPILFIFYIVASSLFSYFIQKRKSREGMEVPLYNITLAC